MIPPAFLPLTPHCFFTTEDKFKFNGFGFGVLTKQKLLFFASRFSLCPLESEASGW